MSLLELVFQAGLVSILTAVVIWGIRFLPGERGQFLAAIPRKREPQDGVWWGVNLTYYGLLTASAQILALLVFLLLAVSAGTPLQVAAIWGAVLLTATAVSASLLARLVEGRRYTLTVGGASVTVLLITPVGVAGIEALGWGRDQLHPPLLVTLVAVAIAFCFGEGLGRLACLSFGCCYGRPIQSFSPFWRKVLSRGLITFSGATKKAVYAGGLGGLGLFPIQAVSAVLLLSLGMGGWVLFFRGSLEAAFLATALPYHLWRVVSEYFRADYRGRGSWSAYQIASLLMVPWSLFWTWFAADASGDLRSLPDLEYALRTTWDPGVLLSLQVLWCILLVSAGISRVTDSRVEFRVRGDRVCAPSGREAATWE
jgi:prolipoprotein diacylglyceryltransferase